MCLEAGKSPLPGKPPGTFIKRETAMEFVYNDGGRSKYFGSSADDCVARAIAIALEADYMEVFERLAAGNAGQRRSSRTGKQRRTAGDGIYTSRKWFKSLMQELGFIWTPTMQVGSGCQVHMRKDELPAGRLVVSLSKHYAAVIDGTLHDTHDCTRGGTRCVYGYWALK
jgi:hypothetical protein